MQTKGPVKTMLVVALLAGACSLLSEVSDLSFDDDVDTETGPDGDADADADTDSDTDTDTDTDTWPPGTCANPHEAGSLPYSATHTLNGMPDAFDNLCMLDCCAGEPERVYRFVPPWDGEYTVEVIPNMAPAYYLVGVLAGDCSDGEWCAAQSGGGMEEYGRDAIGFYAMGGEDYWVVVQSTEGGYLDYWIEIREGTVVEEIGTCLFPYDLGNPPATVFQSTWDQPNSFTQICGSSCCDGADFVFSFTAPLSATYEFTLTNEGITGQVALAMLEMCADGMACLDDTSGAGNTGGLISLTRPLAEWQTVYLVVQGMSGDGDFSLGVDLIPAAGAGTCSEPYEVNLDDGWWQHSDTTQGKSSLAQDYSICDAADPVSEQFPDPESYYRLEAPMPEQYLIEATFQGGSSGVLALMSACGDTNSCFASAPTIEGQAGLLLDADTGGIYYIAVDRNPPGQYTLSVSLCALAPCSGSAADGCCPFECGIELDQDCCNLAPCDDIVPDGCCPEGCLPADDPDC